MKRHWGIALLLLGALMAEPISAQISIEEANRQARSEKGIRTAQELLKLASEALLEPGFDPGAVDGKLGPQTKAAIKHYYDLFEKPPPDEGYVVTYSFLVDFENMLEFNIEKYRKVEYRRRVLTPGLRFTEAGLVPPKTGSIFLDH